jgi:hypothetical protein
MFIGSAPQTRSRFGNQKSFGGHVTEDFRRAEDSVEAGSGNTAVMSIADNLSAKEHCQATVHG